MLGRRILSAAVLASLLAGVILYGAGLPFDLLVGAVAVICAVEYCRMFFPSPRDRGVVIAATALIYGSCVLLPHRLSLPAALLLVMAAAFSFLAGADPAEAKTRRAALAALGGVYIGGFLSTYPRTISLPWGQHWVLLGLVVVAAGDTAAYFSGRAFGRRPLAPRISPNKTVEGAVGGLAAGVVCGTAYAAAFLPDLSAGYAVFASTAVGVVGQGGDLFESLLKRAAGVKDSGALLPGHGGLFDRADAAISSGPVLYLLAAVSPLAGGAG
jgi:phosphatidate cytidylyltransferase